MTRLLSRTAPLLAALAAGLAACNGLSPPSTAPTPGLPARQAAVNSVAPEIVGEDADGAEFRLSDYRGKVVVLSFWAGW